MSIEYRQCKNSSGAMCRGCDKKIVKDEYMIYMYSHRNCGQNIMICLDCINDIREKTK
jgi:hypothetical protein